MKEIPCTIMDEHRDGYLHWIAMIGRGYLPPTGNYLLHIDHHEDFVGGGYDWDMRNMPKTEEEALEFTDKCLGIADFIQPAIWQGIFDTCHLMMTLIPMEIRDEKKIMTYTGGSLLVKDHMPLLHGMAGRGDASDSGQKLFVLRRGGLNEIDELEGAEHIVLDVDLDYFCWDNSLKSVPEKRAEVTEEAYNEFIKDRNHPLRILPKKVIRAKKEDGRFYLVYEEPYERDRIPGEDQIKKRIDRLFAWLGRCRIVPDTIDICRSSRSGYLPAERAGFTEAEFLKRLKEAYPIRETGVCF